MKTSLRWLAGLLVLSMAASCTESPRPSSGESDVRDSLVGAWHSSVRFSGGALAEMKDLEFLYAFNAGGTMTESSNYDGAPPVPPAYGIWRKTGPRQFEAKYDFFVTKAPGTFEEIAKGSGWTPAGRGVLVEKFTLSEDGSSYKSTISFTAFDQAGKPAEGGGQGTGAGTRLAF